MAATFSTHPPRGRPFKKGMAKIGGRKVGALNKHTTTVRWVIGEVARQVGGVDRLVAWIREDPQNEFAFWTQIYPRLLPLRVEGAGEHGEIELSVEREDLARQLAERGLPSVVFGIDKPTLELEARGSNGNGQDHPGGGNGSDR
jgi:hypothetical protein